MIGRDDFIRRVMAVLNDIERDYSYDPSLTPRYVEELFPGAWRTAATSWAARWFNPIPIPLTKGWDVVVRTDEYGGFDLPTLPDSQWHVTGTSYDEESGIAEARVRVETGQLRSMDDGTGYVILPENFLRLYRFRLREWRVPAHVCLEADDHVAALQSNPYTRGTPWRPVVVLETDDLYTYPPAEEGQLPELNAWTTRKGYVLRYYSVTPGQHPDRHDVTEASYIPDLLTMPEEIPVTHECVAPLTYLTASRVCLSMEQADQAKRLEEKVLTLIQQ